MPGGRSSCRRTGRSSSGASRVATSSSVTSAPRASTLSCGRSRAGGLRIVDLGSANGTFVDGRRVDEALLAGGEELVVGGVELAVLARRPASEGGEAPAPTWSTVGRLVDSGTRTARRVTWIALGAAVVALVAVTVLLATGGGDDDDVPQVVRELTPSTRAGRGAARRAADRHGLRLGARRGAGAGGDRRPRASTRASGTGSASGKPRDGVVAAAPCEDLALLRVRGATGLEGRAARQGLRARAGRDGGRARLPGQRGARRRGDLHARRRLGHRRDVPRPLARRARLPATPSRPTPR